MGKHLGLDVHMVNRLDATACLGELPTPPAADSDDLARTILHDNRGIQLNSWVFALSWNTDIEPVRCRLVQGRVSQAARKGTKGPCQFEFESHPGPAIWSRILVGKNGSVTTCCMG